jgi:hypothetical protein
VKSIYITAGLIFILSFGGFAQNLIPQNNPETIEQSVIGGFFSFCRYLEKIKTLPIGSKKPA